MPRNLPEYAFTVDEVMLMMALVADLKPEIYKSNRVKALIYKCKSARTDDVITFKVIDSRR